VAGSVAGLGWSTFQRSAYIKNGSVDRTNESKGHKDLFGEEHDVEINLLGKKSSLVGGMKQMRESAVIPHLG
jgi:hypothetical protein